MASYMYISATDTDPGAGDVLTDPLFGPVPTLGACVPNLRRLVEPGDWIFVISGMKRNLQQYMIGGLRVSERIDAIAAYQRLPNNRMHRDGNGNILGNIPVDSSGLQHNLDGHKSDGFETRIQNYIIGDRSLHIKSSAEVELARKQTLAVISRIKEKQGNRIIDVMGRHAKLNSQDVENIIDWLTEIKQTANG